jgi:phosphatidylserine synthase
MIRSKAVRMFTAVSMVLIVSVLSLIIFIINPNIDPTMVMGVIVIGYSVWSAYYWIQIMNSESD